MNNPKISIITITYNSAAHLEQAIKSVLSQNYVNLEYIIIDGSSTDGTVDIVNKYRDRIAYFKSEPDRGISDAFNKGLKAATGDLIEILNSDDFMMPGVLNAVAEQYEKEVDVYRGYCSVWNEDLNTRHNLYPNERFGVPPFGAIICHESAFISKKLYDKVGGYKVDFRYMMDLDFFIRMYRQPNLKSKFMDLCVITFRTGGASSSPAYKLREERKRLIRDNGGNEWNVFTFVTYHELKYKLKICINTIRAWIKK